MNLFLKRYVSTEVQYKRNTYCTNCDKTDTAHIVSVNIIIIIIWVNNCDNFYQPRVINLEQSTVPYNFD